MLCVSATKVQLLQPNEAKILLAIADFEIRYRSFVDEQFKDICALRVGDKVQVHVAVHRSGSTKLADGRIAWIGEFDPSRGTHFGVILEVVSFSYRSLRHFIRFISGTGARRHRWLAQRIETVRSAAAQLGHCFRRPPHRPSDRRRSLLRPQRLGLVLTAGGEAKKSRTFVVFFADYYAIVVRDFSPEQRRRLGVEIDRVARLS